MPGRVKTVPGLSQLENSAKQAFPGSVKEPTMEWPTGIAKPPVRESANRLLFEKQHETIDYNDLTDPFDGVDCPRFAVDRLPLL